MEDIIEEIFGEIDDEHDQEELIHEMIEENIFIFSARLEIDFINEKYRIQLPVKEDYETLSGMIIYYAETIPESGSNVNIDSFNFKIIEADDTKISKVQLSIIKDD
jgi:CBS domain containing-hemolysin-like protein